MSLWYLWSLREKICREKRLGDCVDEGGCVLFVRGGGVGLRFGCDVLRIVVDSNVHR